MKELMEVVKANKGKIVKRGLIVLGAATGLAIATFAVLKKVNTDEDATGEVAGTAEEGTSKSVE
jgi:hypothetical protein